MVDAGRWNIHYVEEGEGTPLLLIHGLAGDYTAWRPQLAAFRDRHRVIAFDNPGSGRSSHVSQPTSMQQLAEATLRLMDELRIENAHVVGRSMGGAVAQCMALTAPERVRTLVMAASFARLDAVGRRWLESMRDVLTWRGQWAEWARLFSPTFVSPQFFNANPERMALIERLVGDESRDKVSYVNLNNAVCATDNYDAVANIRCPVLIMAGRLDPICSPTATQWMSERIRQAETVYFEQSSHFFLMEEDAKAMQVLGDWLQRHS
jgi:pimeloyl-ACP methyl ester carboxylesterase